MPDIVLTPRHQAEIRAALSGMPFGGSANFRSTRSNILNADMTAEDIIGDLQKLKGVLERVAQTNLSDRMDLDRLETALRTSRELANDILRLPRDRHDLPDPSTDASKKESTR